MARLWSIEVQVWVGYTLGNNAFNKKILWPIFQELWVVRYMQILFLLSSIALHWYWSDNFDVVDNYRDMKTHIQWIWLVSYSAGRVIAESVIYSYGTVLLDLLSGKHIPPSHVCCLHSIKSMIVLHVFEFQGVFFIFCAITMDYKKEYVQSSVILHLKDLEDYSLACESNISWMHSMLYWIPLCI